LPQPRLPADSSSPRKGERSAAAANQTSNAQRRTLLNIKALSFRAESRNLLFLTADYADFTDFRLWIFQDGSAALTGVQTTPIVLVLVGKTKSRQALKHGSFL